MEVEGATEITPNNNTGGNNVNSNNGGPTKDVNNFVHLPFNPDLVDVHRVSSSGQRIKLQVEVNPDYKFLTICDPAGSLADLKAQLELEYAELYPTELPIIIVRLQDSRRNDMPQRFKVGDLLKDKDKIYVVMKPIISEDDNAEASTPAPRQRGRKRKNMDKDIKIQETPNLQQQGSMNSLIPYSPGAKVPLPSQNAERVMCNPYCALIETRDNVPCTHCGELRPYVVPDSEKTDRNQCSKWCVTGSTRKLKAAGLEFCSICLARHRAGKYDLRKSHQCQMCHRPWLHLDEYLFCRTCRKSAMGSDKEPTQIQAPPIINNPLSLLSGNGTPLHLSQQSLSHASPQLPPLSSLTHQQSPLLTHTRAHSPPSHISLLDFHKRSEHDSKPKGEQKTQSIPFQQLHHFQQQSQQLLGVNSPSHPSPSSKDDQKDDSTKDSLHHLQHHDDHGHHHHTQEHHHEDHPHHAQDHVSEHPHPHAHPHAHAHAQDPHSAEQLAEMVLSQIPGTSGQEGETPLGNSFYDPTIPIASSQEKVGGS